MGHIPLALQPIQRRRETIHIAEIDDFGDWHDCMSIVHIIVNDVK
jgi:hypothetical protein